MTSFNPGERGHGSAFAFNKEIVVGECGSLLAAYLAAYGAAHWTSRANLISGAIVAGTLLGGTAGWLTARIAHRREAKRLSVGGLASDIGYFTPAAIALGFGVYDPAIFLVSRFLLLRGSAVGISVAISQAVAFALFLACMNAYRLILAKTQGKHL